MAVNDDEKICGAIVYFSDMSEYGAGGIVTKSQEGSGFRLLAVDSNERGNGIGLKLSKHCIELAKQANHKSVIIHSTMAMEIAWKMYEKIGFERFEEIDFIQENLEVFGFRLLIK